jgi:hypothetical protein
MYHRQMKKARRLAGLSLAEAVKLLLLLIGRLVGALLAVTLILLRRRLRLRVDFGGARCGRLLVLVAHFMNP